MGIITQHSEEGSLIKLKVLTMSVGEKGEEKDSLLQIFKANQLGLVHACNFRHNSQQLPDWPKDKKLSVRALAKKFSIPYTTLYKRINKWVTGYNHWSGGKGNSRILPKEHKGKLNHWTCLQNGI